MVDIGYRILNIKTLSVQLSDLDVYAARIYATIPKILFPIAPFACSKSGNFCGDFLLFFVISLSHVHAGNQAATKD